MTTKNGETPETINLVEMLAGGGKEGALAFHLLNIDYHAAIVASSGEKDAREMLHDLLVKHLLSLEVSMIAETEAGLDVVSPRLIVPER